MYSHGLIRFRCDFFLLLTGRWQLNLSFQAHSSRWKIFWVFHLGFVLYEKDNTLSLKGLPSESMVCAQERLFLLWIFSPRKHNQHAKFGWKCSDHSQMKWINLCILIHDAVYSEACSVLGRWEARAVNLLASQQGPHPSPPYPPLPPVPPPALLLTEQERFLAVLVLGAEAQPLSASDGDGQFSTSALAPEQTLPDWATREQQRRFTPLLLHCRKQTQECSSACLKLGSLCTFY